MSYNHLSTVNRYRTNLGHSRVQTTLDLYTDEDLDEMIAAQYAVRFEAGQDAIKHVDELWGSQSGTFIQ